MAPEETRTTSRPALRTAASASTNASILAGSIPPAGVVREDEPTLTTTRAAAAIAGRRSVIVLVEPPGARARRSGSLGIGSEAVVVLGVVGGVLLPSPPGGRPLLGEPLVLAASAEDLGTDLDLRSEVEHHRVRAADGHPVAGPGAELQQPVLDADPVQPVSQVADGLGVAEVRLTDPALGLLTADAPQVALLGDGELAALVDGPGAQHDPPGRRRRHQGPTLRDQVRHGERQSL